MIIVSKMQSMVCRACLNPKGPFHNLLQDMTAMQAFSKLTEIVILPEDDFPKSICDQCLTLLHELFQFRSKIIESNRILIESAVKKPDSQEIYQQTRLNTENENKTNVESFTKTTNSKRSELTIKEEIEVMYLDTVDTFDDGFVEENICEKKTKEIKKKKKRKTERSQLPTKTPRVFIHLDPEKITTISLSKEQQIQRQHEESLKPEYLDMPHKCEKCYKGFNYERKLRTHLEKYHKINSKFECDVCTRTMSNAVSLDLHMKKHELLYECNICKSCFVEKPRAILHYQSKHEGVDPEYPCTQCEKVFRNRSTLNGHTRNHHPLTERPRCSVCDKTFVSKDSYEDHMLIHTGEKNYPCPVCGALFRLRQCARRHCGRGPRAPRPSNTARGGQLGQKHQCSTCNRHFTTAYGLRKHASLHNDTLYTCPVCGKRVRAARRDAHEASHAGGVVNLGGGMAWRERGVTTPPIRGVCHYCGKAFTARRPLERHLMSHEKLLITSQL